MSDKHFIYGRVHLFGASSNFLNQDGCVGRTNEGDVDFTLFVYATTREEAQSIVNTARATAHEFDALADDLERYIDAHDFTKPGGVRQPEAEAKVYVGARAEYETLPELRKS